MPRKKHHYLGNPVFQHLRIDDGFEKVEPKEPCQQHHVNTSEGLSYQVEGEAPQVGQDGQVVTKSRDVGTDEQDLQAETIGRKLGSRRRRTGEAFEVSEPFQQLGAQQRSSGGISGSPSRRPMTSSGPPPRELRVRLTKNLSTRMNSIRRFVDFTICNSESSQRQFQVVKGDEDVYRIKNHDYLLRLRITMITKRDQDDPYVKDYIAEFKFRGRLYKYNEEKESFEELAVVSQCMAICPMAECRRVPTLNPTFNLSLS
ncbi:unnamed protein product [Calypogeia fissa]